MSRRLLWDKFLKNLKNFCAILITMFIIIGITYVMNTYPNLASILSLVFKYLILFIILSCIVLGFISKYTEQK